MLWLSHGVHFADGCWLLFLGVSSIELELNSFIDCVAVSMSAFLAPLNVWVQVYAFYWAARRTASAL